MDVPLEKQRLTYNFDDFLGEEAPERGVDNAEPHDSRVRDYGLTLCEEQNPTSCAWRTVHSVPFEVIVIIVILMNMGLMIYDEIRDSECALYQVWIGECVFNGFYSVEFILRILADKSKYLPGTLWGFFDASILVLGLINIGRPISKPAWNYMDKCELIAQTDQQKHGRVVHFVFIFRFLRFFRVIRIFRFFLRENSPVVRRMRDKKIFVAHETAAAMASAMDYIRNNVNDHETEETPLEEYATISRSNSARIKVLFCFRETDIARSAF